MSWETKLSSRGWARSFAWWGWPIKPRARRWTVPFWLVVSSVPHLKSSSIYALPLYGTSHYILLPISSSFSCQASCVPSKTIHPVCDLVLFMLATQHSGLCCPFETNFWWFQNSTVDERRSSFYKNMLSLAFLKGLECWLSMSHLNELFEIATRSSAPSNLVTFPRQMRGVRSSSFHKMFRQLSSTFEFYWLLTEHVSFGWAFTSYNQVFSCKQFGDFFSTDERCSFFIPPQKILTVV